MAAPRLVETVSEPPIPTAYANSTRLMFSVYDFRVVFTEQMMGKEFDIVQVDRVSVVMSPQHIKQLVKTITAKLAEYEQTHGLIPEAEEPEQPVKRNASPAIADEA